ncbi:MAG: hypothetical protein ABMA25_00445 [Ilumatobacteraceae bacterium]
MARSPATTTRRRWIDATVDQLLALLPTSWTIRATGQEGDVTLLSVGDATGVQGKLKLLTTDRLEPRDTRALWLPTDAPVLLSADWLSERTREVLRERGASYIDRTGNVEIQLDRPGMFIRTSGAVRDPDPKPTNAPSLRGPRAWAMLRTLIEVDPPYTAGDLATALGVDNGYVSRVLQVLADELVIERAPRGPVTAAEWEPLLRMVTANYSLLGANTPTSWVAAAGPSQLVDDLPKLRIGRWAVTGSFVASSISPVAAPEMAVIYTEDAERLAKAARLLPAKVGANVVLAEPYDPIVFERGTTTNGMRMVSVAQAAIDCLTGPGRMPAEGEALLAWMRRNPKRWRAATLQG